MKIIKFMDGGSSGGAMENAMKASLILVNMKEKVFTIGPQELNTMGYSNVGRSLDWGLGTILIAVFTMDSGLKEKIMAKELSIGKSLFKFY